MTLFTAQIEVPMGCRVSEVQCTGKGELSVYCQIQWWAIPVFFYKGMRSGMSFKQCREAGTRLVIRNRMMTAEDESTWIN